MRRFGKSDKKHNAVHFKHTLKLIYFSLSSKKCEETFQNNVTTVNKKKSLVKAYPSNVLKESSFNGNLQQLIRFAIRYIKTELKVWESKRVCLTILLGFSCCVLRSFVLNPHSL